MSLTLIYENYGLLLQFLILFGISGWLTFRLAFNKNRDTLQNNFEIICSKNSTGNLIETILLSVICGLIPTSFGLLTLAQINLSQLRYLFLGLITYATVALVFLLRSKRLRLGLPHLEKSQFQWSDLCLLLILFLGVFSFGKPTEYVTTQRDPGKYTNIAIQLAQMKG